MQQFLFLSHSFNAKRASTLGLPLLSGVLAPPPPPQLLSPLRATAHLKSGEATLLTSVFIQGGVLGSEGSAQAGWGLAPRLQVCHRGLFPPTQVQSWHCATSWLACIFFFFFSSFRSFKPVYLWATWGPGSRQTNLGTSREEGRERGTLQGDNGVRQKVGTPLPLQNPSFSLQFNTHLPSSSPYQALPSDTEKYRASSERDQKTPHSSLLRRELLSLSLCHESMKDGMTNSAMVAKAGSREEVT